MATKAGRARYNNEIARRLGIASDRSVLALDTREAIEVFWAWQSEYKKSRNIFKEALETVIDGETGILFDEPTAASLATALERAAATTFDPARLRRHAEQFSKERHVRGQPCLRRARRDANAEADHDRVGSAVVDDEKDGDRRRSRRVPA